MAFISAFERVPLVFLAVFVIAVAQAQISYSGTYNYDSPSSSNDIVRTLPTSSSSSTSAQSDVVRTLPTSSSAQPTSGSVSYPSSMPSSSSDSQYTQPTSAPSQSAPNNVQLPSTCNSYRCVSWIDSQGRTYSGDAPGNYLAVAVNPRCMQILCANKYVHDNVYDYGAPITLSSSQPMQPAPSPPPTQHYNPPQPYYPPPQQGNSPPSQYNGPQQSYYPPQPTNTQYNGAPVYPAPPPQYHPTPQYPTQYSSAPQYGSQPYASGQGGGYQQKAQPVYGNPTPATVYSSSSVPTSSDDPPEASTSLYMGQGEFPGAPPIPPFPPSSYNFMQQQRPQK